MTGWKFLGTAVGDDGVYLDNASGIYTAPEGMSLPRFNDDGYARLCRCGLIWHQFEWYGCPGSEVEGPWLPLTLRDALHITLAKLWESPVESKSSVPKPSTAPPMWAVDVNRTRRPRRNRNQPNRQGIA